MDYQSALLDQGWFRDYSSSDDWQRLLVFLHQLGNPSLKPDARRMKRRHLFNPTSNAAPRQSGFYLLERAFEFERLFVDKEALRLRGEEIPDEFRDFIIPLTPDLETYNRSAEMVREEINRTPQSLKNELYELGFWPKTEYFDRVFNSKGSIPASIAESEPHNDWTRAMFYLAFSEAIGVTPLLSGTKARFAQDLGARMLESQHDHVRRIFDKAFQEKWRSISEPGASAWDLWSQDAPPILEYITNQAINTDRSAYDLFMDLRGSKPAQDYRRLLGHLRECFSNGRAAQFEAIKVCNELSKVAKAWSSTLDLGAQVNYVPRKLKLRCIPVIGKILEFLQMDKLPIKDKILGSPPGYLVFCSTWYSESFDYEFGRSDGPP